MKKLLSIVVVLAAVVSANAGAILWSVMDNMVFVDDNDTEGMYLDEAGINAARVRMFNLATGESTYLKLFQTGIDPEGHAHANPTASTILTWVFDPDTFENYAGPVWTEDKAVMDDNHAYQIEAGSWDGNIFTPIAASNLRQADDEVYINYAVSWQHGSGILRNAYSDDPLAYPQMGHWNEDFYMNKIVPDVPEPATGALALAGFALLFRKREN